MAWVRRVVVTLLLLAPIALVTAIAWPEDGDDGGVREEGSGPDGALVAGDTVQDQLGFGQVATYRLVADEEVRIDVTGLPDGTLTIRDGGEEVAFNDDTNGLDPRITIDPDGRELTVEVRDLGGQAGVFTLTVD